jgi:hypothetical protein
MPSGRPGDLRLRCDEDAPRVLGPGTFVGLVLLDVNVLALPDVPREVAEDAGEVVVAPATGGGSLAKHAAAHYAAEPLVLWM